MSEKENLENDPVEAEIESAEAPAEETRLQERQNEESQAEQPRVERVSEVIAKTIASEQAQEKAAAAETQKKAKKKRGFGLKFSGKNSSETPAEAGESGPEAQKQPSARQQKQAAKAAKAAQARAEQAQLAAQVNLAEATYQPKQVTLSLARLDAWSVMKITFLLSVCFGIAMVFAALLLWLILNGMQVFSSLEHFITDIDPSGTVSKLIDYLRLPRVLALSTIVAVSNVILLSAFMTIGAMLYNLTASLVGGVRVILTDD